MPHVPEVRQSRAIEGDVEDPRRVAAGLQCSDLVPGSAVPLGERPDAHGAPVGEPLTRARAYFLTETEVVVGHALKETAAEVMLTPAEPLMSMLLSASIVWADPAWWV